MEERNRVIDHNAITEEDTFNDVMSTDRSAIKPQTSPGMIIQDDKSHALVPIKSSRKTFEEQLNETRGKEN